MTAACSRFSAQRCADIHHAVACGTLGHQPGQIGGGVAGIECQGARADHLQGGQGGAGCAQAVRRYGAIGHAFAVEGVVGVALGVEVDDGQ